MKPDLIIIGDSHSGALHAGALSLGLNSRMLFFSGKFWHRNLIRGIGPHGLSVSERPQLDRRIAEFANEIGGHVFPRDVPVIASIGYHLGRLAPPLRNRGFSLDPEHFRSQSGANFLSSTFVDEFIVAHRFKLFRLLQAASRRTKLIVVKPPIVTSDPVTNALSDRITNILVGRGIRVFDMPAHEGWVKSVLPDIYKDDDLTHATTDYGALVLRRLSAQGVFELPSFVASVKQER